MRRNQKDAAVEVGTRNLFAIEGGLVPIENAAKLYGGAKPFTESAILELVERRQMISIRDRNVLCFPTWQFASGGGTLRGLIEVLSILEPRTRVDSLAAFSFFLRTTMRLGGISPLDALRKNDQELVAQVKRLAVEYVE